MLFQTILISSSPLKSANVGLVAGVPSRGEGALSSSFSSGAHQRLSPTPERRFSFAGFTYSGINGALYDRLLFDQSSITLGYIARDVYVPILLWNGYRESIEVEVVSHNADGIALLGETEPPYFFPPLGVIQLTLRAGVQGAGTINASFDLVVAKFSSIYTLRVTGSRVVLLPVRPDWKRGVQESLEWLTDILTMRDGAEQRFSIREEPRRAQGFDVVLSRREASLLRSFLATHQARSFVAPVWTDKGYLTETAHSGGAFIYLDTKSRGYREGGLVALLGAGESFKTFEVVEIAKVNDESLEMLRPLSNTWTRGTVVAPAEVVRLPQSISFKMQSSAVMTGNIFMDWVEASKVESAAPTVVYEGLEVLPFKPNWSDTVDVDSIFPQELVDFQTGRAQLYAAAEFAKPVFGFGFVLKGKDTIHAFRQFLMRRAGRRVPLLLPSQRQDFTLARAVTGNEGVLYVADSNFIAVEFPSRTAKRIQVRTTKGSVIRTITNGLLGENGVEEIHLNEPVGFSFTPADVLELSLVYTVRMASDKIEMVWVTDEVVRVELKFTAINEDE